MLKIDACSSCRLQSTYRWTQCVLEAITEHTLQIQKKKKKKKDIPPKDDRADKYISTDKNRRFAYGRNF